MSLARWQQPWASLGLQARMELHADLRQRYSEPHRAYHTLHHIAQCLHLLEQAQAQADYLACIEIAIWFHDAIYNPRRSDNEARSADWARREIRRAGGGTEVQDYIGRMIMISCHDSEPETPDEHLFSDIDLAMLGSGPARFDEYEKQVRTEYRHVPTDLYRPARRKLLGGFLARPQIYGTEWFRQRYEAQARTNLQSSLTRLAGKFW